MNTIALKRGSPLYYLKGLCVYLNLLSHILRTDLLKKMSPKFIAKYDKTSFWNALKDKSGS